MTSSIPTPNGARVAVWGAFDGPDVEGPLSASVLTWILRDALPGVTVQLFAPHGSKPRVQSATMPPAQPLGAWGDVDLDDSFDGLWVFPSLTNPSSALPGSSVESIPPPSVRPPGLPVAIGPLSTGWGSAPTFETEDALASLSAGDLVVAHQDLLDRSPQVTAGGAEGVPALSPLFSVSQVLPADSLDARVELLKILGWYPRSAGVLAIEARAGLAYTPEELSKLVVATMLDGEYPCVVSTGVAPEDQEFAQRLVLALEASIPTRVSHLPSVALAEDVVAAFASSTRTLAISEVGGAIRMSYGRPLLWAGGPEWIRTVAPREERGDLVGPAVPSLLTSTETRLIASKAEVELRDAAARFALRVADYFGRQSASARPSRDVERLEVELALLRTAHQARVEIAQREAVAFSDRVSELEAALAQEIDESRRLEAALVRREGAFVAAEDARNGLEAATARIIELENTIARYGESGSGGRDTPDPPQRIQDLERALTEERARRTEVEGEIDRLRSTRTFRYSRKLRRVYGAFRRATR